MSVVLLILISIVHYPKVQHHTIRMMHQADLTETQLRFEFRKFKYFVTEEVPQVRRETMWIELLEAFLKSERND